MKKGSLSVFFALILTFVMALTFSLAELIRVHSILNAAEEVTEASAESAFSEYNKYLWDQYKILAVDLGYMTGNRGTGMMEEHLKRFASDNANPKSGLKFTRISASEAVVENYGLLTDYGGAAVLYEGAAALRGCIASDAIDGIVGNTNSISVEEKDPDGDVNSGKSSINEMKAAMEAEKEAANAEERPPSEWAQVEPEEVEDNPLDAFDRIKEMMAAGVLATLISEEPSAELIDTSNSVERRSLQTGTSGEAAQAGELDKILYCQYLISSMSYYGHDMGHDGIDYEVEYILAAKDSDKENLAAIAERLLLVREAVNVGAILSDGNLRSQVTSMATILSSFAPAIQPIVEVALIAAWAYIESVVEVRALLANGKVASLKNSSNWNTDLWHLSNYFDVNCKAANVEGGISYKAYLRTFLALESREKIAFRSCDVFENALHTQSEYASSYTDNMIFKGDISLSYTGNQLFASLFKLPINKLNGYEFKRTYHISY